MIQVHEEFQKIIGKRKIVYFELLQFNVECISGNDCRGCQNSRPGKLNSLLSLPSMNFVIIKQWT